MLLTKESQEAAADIFRTQVRVLGSCPIECEGARVTIPAPSALPFGLAIHELAADAAVHGALSRGKGKLRISWVPSGPGW